MSTMKITAEVLLPGTSVIVQNYRASDQWEEGKITGTEIRVDTFGVPRVRYDVWVKRTPKKPFGKEGYTLVVGSKSIRKN